MNQNTFLVPGDRVYLGTITNPDENARGYPCLISTEIRTLLRGRYGEFGEPTFHKVPRSTPSGLSRVKLSFSKRPNPRTGMGYEFNYSEDTLPEGVTEDELFGELTSQVREVLLEDRPLGNEHIDNSLPNHQYTERARPMRLRDDDEAKLRIAYATSGSNTSYTKTAKEESIEDASRNEDQEIEKIAVQAQYWSCRSDEKDEAAADPK